MLNELAKEIHALAVEKGWYDTERGFPELIALMHSELSEALEAYRDGDDPSQRRIYCTVIPEDKPEGIPAELADCIIRILDACGYYGIDIDMALKAKMAHNRTRPYRHGDKRA